MSSRKQGPKTHPAVSSGRTTPRSEPTGAATGAEFIAATPTSRVLLVHLSDLHFGASHRFPIADSPQRRRTGVRLGRAIREAATVLGGQHDQAVVVVTGDITDTAQADEFAAAREVLEAIGGELGISNRRFVFAPGNHDVDWIDSHIAELQAKKARATDTQLREAIDNHKLDNYKAFLSEFYGRDEDAALPRLARGARRFDFEDIATSIIALNSCERESHLKDDHIGEVSQEQAQAAADSWLDPATARFLRVLAVHHNPDHPGADNVTGARQWLASQTTITPEQSLRIIADLSGFTGSEFVKGVATERGVVMLLHGHQHHGTIASWKWPVDGETLVLGAGSTAVVRSQLPGSQPNQIRLVVVDRITKRLRARVLVWDPRARGEGDVELGAFVPGQGEGDNLDTPVAVSTLDVPTPKEPQARGREAAVDSRLREFLLTYRQRLTHAWADWDLRGMAAVGGPGQPVAATLDSMYQPIRIGANTDPNKLDTGKIIDAGAILRRQKPLLIRGIAGAGKTTWMRYTFRRLLERSDVAPFMLVLRDVATRWAKSDISGEHRSLDACLQASVAERMGSGWDKALFKRLLTSSSGPVPVLLVDGWDELGDHGQKFRELLLGFMEEHPHLRVVVSTRPWGESVPGDTQGFEVLNVQPLSDAEISDFAFRFFKKCYALDATAASAELERFKRALKASPDALSLGRTALFLTMMLVVSRHKPLPDKRHQLYRECVSTLLKDRPEAWARDGVLRSHGWWGAQDSEQRWKAVASLAWQLQARGYNQWERKAVVASAEEVCDALPADWPRDRKQGFLLWLVGEAGLLADRADGTYTFTHLSFQEYLTAWQIEATVVDGDWAAPALERVSAESWWETIQLYAALVGGTSDARVDTIITALTRAGGSGVSLAGMMVADGIGTEPVASSWVTACVSSLEWGAPDGWVRCAGAWAQSQQGSRRALFSAALNASVVEARPWHWTRGAAFAERARFGAPPHSRAPNSRVLLGNERSERGPRIGLMRGMQVWSALWPGGEAGLLQVWPSDRRILGARLQAAAVAGASKGDILDLIRLLAGRADESQVALGGDLLLAVQEDIRPNFPGDLILRQDLTKGDPRLLVYRRVVEIAVGEFCPYLGTLLAYATQATNTVDMADALRRFALQYLRHFIVGGDWRYRNGRRGLFRFEGLPHGLLAEDSAEFWRVGLMEVSEGVVDRGLGRYFADKLAVSIGRNDWPWMPDFLTTELLSLDRWAPRSLLASLPSPDRRSERKPLTPFELLQAACRRALFGEQEADARPSGGLVRAIARAQRSVQPIWIALARVVAGVGSDSDREQLTQFAADPMSAGPELADSMRFVVRADVVLGDGEIARLDDLCTAAGVAALPLLGQPAPATELTRFLEHDSRWGQPRTS